MSTDYQMYIAGEWCESASGRRAPATSPANGEGIGTLPEGGREDVARAVAAARAAGREWARRSAFERAVALLLPCPFVRFRLYLSYS